MCIRSFLVQANITDNYVRRLVLYLYYLYILLYLRKQDGAFIRALTKAYVKQILSLEDVF